MNSEDDIGDEEMGNYGNLNCWIVKLPKFFFNNHYFCLAALFKCISWNLTFEWMSKYIHEEKKSQMNVCIYSPWKNPRIFARMNIFVSKHSNIFEYPNICYTLLWSSNNSKTIQLKQVQTCLNTVRMWTRVWEHACLLQLKILQFLADPTKSWTAFQTPLKVNEL